MAAASLVKGALWLQRLQRDVFCTLLPAPNGLCVIDVQLGGSPAAVSRGTLLFTDNQAALELLRSSIVSQRVKHIDVLYHFVGEKVQFMWISCVT